MPQTLVLLVGFLVFLCIDAFIEPVRSNKKYKNYHIMTEGLYISEGKLHFEGEGGANESSHEVWEFFLTQMYSGLQEEARYDPERKKAHGKFHKIEDQYFSSVNSHSRRGRVFLTREDDVGYGERTGATSLSLDPGRHMTQ